VEPELTALVLATAQEPGHSVFLLRLDLPLEPGVDEAAAVAPLCFSEPPRRTDLALCS
jgi:hypothetical protein